MADDNRDVIRRFYKEVLENSNVDFVDDVCMPTFVDHALPPGQGYSADLRGMKTFIRDFVSGVSGISVEVHDIIQQGDIVASRVTLHGTHTGAFLGIPATGKRLTWVSSDWVRFEGGKVAEHWSVDDNLALMQSIGVIPEKL